MCGPTWTGIVEWTQVWKAAFQVTVLKSEIIEKLADSDMYKRPSQSNQITVGKEGKAHPKTRAFLPIPPVDIYHTSF